MNFLNLEYFLVVAEELSFTKASQRLFISQQSLSNHIQKLEEYFGTSLFLRTNPLTLTPSGLYLCDKARQLLMFRDNLCQELQDIDRFDSGALTIGSTHSRSRFLLPLSINIFHHKFPNIELRLFEGTTPQVEEQLHKGALDLSIGFLPSDVSHIGSIPLYDELFFVIVPIKLIEEYYGELATEIIRKLDNHFDISLLKDFPFLNMTPDTKLCSIFKMYMEERGVTPKILMVTPNIETLIAMCYEGLGVTICPETFLRYSYYDVSRFKLYPIETGYSRRSIVINYPTNRYLSLAAQEFIEILKNVLQTK